MIRASRFQVRETRLTFRRVASRLSRALSSGASSRASTSPSCIAPWGKLFLREQIAKDKTYPTAVRAPWPSNGSASCPSAGATVSRKTKTLTSTVSNVEAHRWLPSWTTFLKLPNTHA